MKGHYWNYCHLCGHEVVICGECGNNTCNGGYGEVDGEECGSCQSAYDLYLNTSPENRPKQTKEQCSRCGVWMDLYDMCIAPEFCRFYNA